MTEEKVRELIDLLVSLKHSEEDRAMLFDCQGIHGHRAEGAATAYGVAAQILFEAIGE
ncbi:hypothetical protein [Mycobacteroides abscessus]|uniref:hypothetical protein n=1 Tax=Mycobacteroides abscessus TaxID=36809 RepID=UPI001300002E|nr:hypothetical protein [Mycobacteroides abscessus]